MANVLVVAPHPDDEILGAGGTLLKHVENKDNVYACIVTKANQPEYSEEAIKEKRKEALDASKNLGARKTFFLDFPTLRLDTIPMFELQKKILDIVNDIKPEIMYVPHDGDVNQDHRKVREACNIVARPMPGSPVRKIYAFEIPCSTGWASMNEETVFVPNVFVDIKAQLKKKLEIMSIYKTELREHPHPRSLKGIEIFAKHWGAIVGMEAAEAFKLVREIKSG